MSGAVVEGGAHEGEPGSEDLVLAVDIGKTGCRALMGRGGRTLWSGAGAGFIGLAEPGGADAAMAAITGLLPPGLPSGSYVGVGAAGLPGAAAEGERLARSLGAALRAAAVAVTSDVVTAHVGALSGGPGTVLSAGTGAVALGVSADGSTLQIVDGWGQWLGDEGSGSWVGREALRAAVRSADGRGPQTELLARATELFGPLMSLPTVLAASPGGLPRATAGFVPQVLAAARNGDSVARAVLAEAAEALAETALTAARGTGTRRVSLLGGLVHAGADLLTPWREAVREQLDVVEPDAGAVQGAALVARRTDLPHEALVSRVITGGQRERGSKWPG